MSETKERASRTVSTSYLEKLRESLGVSPSGFADRISKHGAENPSIGTFGELLTSYAATLKVKGVKTATSSADDPRKTIINALIDSGRISFGTIVEGGIRRSPKDENTYNVTVNNNDRTLKIWVRFESNGKVVPGYKEMPLPAVTLTPEEIALLSDVTATEAEDAGDDVDADDFIPQTIASQYETRVSNTVTTPSGRDGYGNPIVMDDDDDEL